MNFCSSLLLPLLHSSPSCVIHQPPFHFLKNLNVSWLWLTARLSCDWLRCHRWFDRRILIPCLSYLVRAHVALVGGFGRVRIGGLVRELDEILQFSAFLRFLSAMTFTWLARWLGLELALPRLRTRIDILLLVRCGWVRVQFATGHQSSITEFLSLSWDRSMLFWAIWSIRPIALIANIADIMFTFICDSRCFRRLFAWEWRRIVGMLGLHKGRWFVSLTLGIRLFPLVVLKALILLCYTLTGISRLLLLCYCRRHCCWCDIGSSSHGLLFLVASKWSTLFFNSLLHRWGFLAWVGLRLIFILRISYKKVLVHFLWIVELNLVL